VAAAAGGGGATAEVVDTAAATAGAAAGTPRWMQRLHKLLSPLEPGGSERLQRTQDDILAVQSGWMIATSSVESRAVPFLCTRKNQMNMKSHVTRRRAGFCFSHPKAPGMVHASLEEWGAVHAYRSGYRVHMLCTGVIILAQGLLIAINVSTVRLALLTVAVNLPFMFIRHHLQGWEDGVAAHRVGAPLQVAYTLLKPSLLMGLAFQFLGPGALPVLTPDIIRVGEAASPMLLLIDGFLFASLGLSLRWLVASVAALEVSVLCGALFAVLPAEKPGEPPLAMSNLGVVMGSMGLFLGALIGHQYTQAMVERAASTEWDRLQRLQMPPTESSKSREDTLINKRGRRPFAAETVASPLSSSRTSRSNSGGGGPACGTHSGGVGLPPFHLARHSIDEDTSSHRLSNPPVYHGAGEGAGAFGQAELARERNETSTISDFMGGSDAISVAGSTATTNSSTTRLSEWEAARAEERRADAAAEMEAWSLSQIGLQMGEGLRERHVSSDRQPTEREA
jgi:hypothetical protein